MPDVAVVGGGVIGCSIAWQLARRGARVTLLEPGTPGGGATWASAGMLSPLGEAVASDRPESAGRRAFRRLAVASFERWPAFADELREASGVDVALATNGKVHVALEEHELLELDSLIAGGAEHGVERLTVAEARTLEPALSERIAGAILVRRDYRVDNRKLGEAARRAARGAGVRFEVGRITRVESGDTAADPTARLGFENGGEVSAPAVVVAAGAWSGAIGGLPTRLPVRPVRGQMFSVASSVTGVMLSRSVQSASCYLVPRGDLVLTGATVDEVGWAVGPTPAGIATLVRAAVDVVPAIADAPLVESWAGFRPGTPDDLPILGRDPEAAGVVYATGHFRNGILLTPITAEAIADVVTGAAPAVDLAPLSISRFREPAS